MGPAGTGTVAGVVSDAQSQEPISGATVTIAGRAAQSASDGRFQLSEIAAGGQTLSATSPGYADFTTTVTVASGETVEMPIRLGASDVRPTSSPRLVASQGQQPGTILLEWSAAPGATSYSLYWSSSPGVTPLSGTRLPQAGTSAVHSGLTPGTAYYYVVTGINDTGEGPPSGEALATARNDIQLSIVRPVAAFVPGSVDVAVRITSVFQLANVVVVAAGQSPSLVYNASSVLWEGTISLTTAGVPAQIVVTATDVQGTTAVASAAVIPQSLVALAVSSPAEGSVIQGTVRLTATCQNCASISVSPDRIVGFPSVTLATGPSPMDQTVSLGQYNGFAVSLRFVATGNGQQVSIVRNVYVETSPQREIVSTMGGRALILDVTADRILVSDSLTGTFAVRVRDRSTGADAVLFTGAPSNQRPRVGALTPGGALFVVGGTLYEARSGSVAQVGQSVTRCRCVSPAATRSGAICVF